MCGDLYRGEMTFDGLMLHASDQARHLLAAHTAGHAAIAAALNPPTTLTDAALRELAGCAGTAGVPSGDVSSSPDLVAGGVVTNARLRQLNETD